MQLFSDGRIQIWCVFHGDGCECCDFVGAFETEEQANEAADRVRANAKGFHDLLNLGDGWEWTGYVVVQTRILGEYQLPHPLAELTAE